MKILLLLLFASTLQAQVITFIPKDSAHPFGKVIVTPDSAKPNQPTVIFLHGIGERGDGSLIALKRLAAWPGINAKADLASFFKAGNYFGFNIVCVQTANSYAAGEIRYAYDYAKNVLQADTNNIHIACNSLGGYGFAREVAKDVSLPKLFASITMVVMGPGTSPTTAASLAKSGRPIWFFTSSNDTLAGTHFKVTDNLYNEVKSLGGIAWKTKYINKGHSVFPVVAGAWGTAKGQPGSWKTANPSNATDLNTPLVTWYQWMFNNHKGQPIKSPMDAYVPYVAPMIIPVPAPVPIPIKKPVFILFSDGTWQAA